MGYGVVSILGCMNHLTTLTSAAICCPPCAAKKMLISVSRTSYAKGLSLGHLTSLLLTSIVSAHAIGVVDKKYSTKKRLIVDLSAPHHKAGHPSISQLIDKDEFSLSYVKIDDAIRTIVHKGRGAKLCKTDIVDAFKLMPIHPKLWPFLWYLLEG